MMRDNQGRPNEAIMPQVVLADAKEPIGHIITILNKTPGHSLVPEMKHLAGKTNDPAERRDQALQMLSATYYQKAHEFSDILTSTFPPASRGAARITKAQRCELLFDAYGQSWRLDCKIRHITAQNPLYDATLAHNRLFNPGLPDTTIVLGFEPNWDNSEVTVD